VAYLALVRHGETAWNRAGRFTGWADEPLTDQGEADARAAGRVLTRLGVNWDVIHTSKLRRSAHTAELAFRQLRVPSSAMTSDWRLNERHVGDLEGATYEAVTAAHGRDAVDLWRWGWDVRPPAIAPDDPRQAAHRARYREVGAALPVGESLQDVIARVRPWLDETLAHIAAGRNVIAVTHGTTLRALRTLIEKSTPEQAFSLRPLNGSVVLFEQTGSGSLRFVDV
jgi:2,3-bisphosphoglycerate-dependent phosphoglycerate mutase